MPNDEGQVYTIVEAAARLRLNQEVLRRMIRQGRIHAVKIGNRYLLSEVEIARVLTEGTGSPPRGGADRQPIGRKEGAS